MSVSQTKLRPLSALPLLLPLVLTAPALSADGWSLKPGLRGVIEFDDKRDFDNESYGASLGLEYFYGHWGSELQLFGGDSKTSAGFNDIDMMGARLNQYLYTHPESAFSPYLVLGVGHVDYNGKGEQFNEKATQARGGLGFRHNLTDHLAWWLEVSAEHDIDDSLTDSVVGIGLRYSFAEQAAAKRVQVPAAPPLPSDNDNDGVSDGNDLCPDTAVGLRVDSKGCALDTDGDGVPDSLDKCPQSLPSVKVDDSGCKFPVTRVEEVRLDVQFQSNSSYLQPGSELEIEKLALFMKKHQELNVVLEGHTDSTGPDSYNLDLSKRRAERVKQILTERHAIAAHRISTLGLGETQPIASNDSYEGRAKNRRVIAALVKQISE